MTAPLHLLRPFTQWTWRGRHLTTIEEAEEYVGHIAELGFDRFYTATGRAPRRVDEMAGGSVYFCRKGYTLFRMPLICVTHDPDTAARFQGEVLIEMEPRVIRVLPKRVGFLRGWRYMAHAARPEDVFEGLRPDEPPAEMQRELKELGLG